MIRYVVVKAGGMFTALDTVTGMIAFNSTHRHRSQTEQWVERHNAEYVNELARRYPGLAGDWIFKRLDDPAPPAQF